MQTLLKDLRYGYRTLLRNPGFTFIAVLSLALGIGANTAIFSFIDTVLLKQLPVRSPRELELFGDGTGRGTNNDIAQGPRYLFSWREYKDLRASNQVFEDLLAVDSQNYRIYAAFNSEREPLRSTFVSGNYFAVLGITPQNGRFFDDSVNNGPSPYAVLSDAFWARRFHRDPAIVGSTFRAGNRDVTILGVAPRGFFGTRVGESPDVWLPVTMQPDFPSSDLIRLEDPKSHFLNLIGRRRPGVSPQQAEAGINVTYRQLLPHYKGNPPDPREDQLIRTATIALAPADKGISTFRRKYETPLTILMAVVALVLLIACANVANLLMALGAKRQREMAVRMAIGAARARLIRQVLTEGIMLSAVGGFLGIVFAIGAGMVLVHLISPGPSLVPIAFELNTPVLAFTVAISLLTGVAFSFAPALRSSRTELNTSLKEGKATMSSPRKVNFGRLMVISQVALSLALLVTAGMLLHSFENLVRTDTGFQADRVLLFKIDSESSGYKQDAKLAALYGRIDEAVSRVPGVASASVAYLSFHEGGWRENMSVPGVNLPSADSDASLNFVTPGYFSTFGIPLLAGRTLQPRDDASAPLAAVIDETFARKVFGSVNAVGRTFKMAPLTDKDQLYTVVGVVGDIKSRGVRDKPENAAWLALAQGAVFAGNIAIRVSADPSVVASRVRAAIHEVEPNLPVRYVISLKDEIGESLVSERALAQLAGFFAALALLLSAIGLYGTISFTVARRTGEIGIRMALGAATSGVLGMVLKDAMTLVALGMLAGLPLAFLAGRFLGSILYGLSSFDILSAAVAVLALSVVAAIAGYLPARRASRVDPITALRYE
jgi:predicted permease